MAALNRMPFIARRSPIEDYLTSRVITSPLRVYDCDTHIDGSTAFCCRIAMRHVTWRGGPSKSKRWGCRSGGIGVGYHRGDFTYFASDKAGQMMWSRHGPQA